MAAEPTTHTAWPERYAMRREAVLALLERRPNLTVREVHDELSPDVPGGLTCSWPYHDLCRLQAQRKVEAVHVNARTVLWRARQPVAMPLGWEGDDG